MRRIGTNLLILVLGAWCGFCLAGLLESDPRGEWGQVATRGTIKLRSGHLIMKRGSELRFDLPGAERATSFILSMSVDFQDLNDFAVVLVGTFGRRTLMDADLGLGTLLEKRAGLLEIGFDGASARVQYDGGTQRKIDFALKDLRAVVIEARSSQVAVAGFSAVARTWEGWEPIETRVLAEWGRESARPRVPWIVLMVLAGMISAAVYCRGERELILSFSRLGERSIGVSQVLSLVVAGAGLALAESTRFFEGTLPVVLALFVYLRLRFVVGRLGLADLDRGLKWSTKPGVILFFLATLAAGLGIRNGLIQAGLTKSLAELGGLAAALTPFGIAGAYALLSGRRILACVRAVGWSSIPLGLSGLHPAFLPLSAFAMGWPSRATKTFRGAGPMILLLSFLIFPALEFAVRIATPQSTQRPANLSEEFQADKLLFYVPRNFFHYTPDYLERDNYKVEALALRGGVTPFEKDKDVFRILVLGGSNVWGQGIERVEDTFCAQLEVLLNAQDRPLRIEVLNGGVRGYNSFQTMLFFTRYAHRFQPDLLLLYMNRNDVVSVRGLGRLRALLSHEEDAFPLTKLREILRHSSAYNLFTRRLARMRRDIPLITSIEETTLKDVNPPEDVKANMRDMAKKAEEIGARVALVLEFWGEQLAEGAVDRRFTSVREATKALAEEEGLPIFDAYAAFGRDYALYDVVFRHDPVHLTVFGHAELAKMLSEFLTNEGLIPGARRQISERTPRPAAHE